MVSLLWYLVFLLLCLVELCSCKEELTERETCILLCGKMKNKKIIVLNTNMFMETREYMFTCQLFLTQRCEICILGVPGFQRRHDYIQRFLKTF